MRSEIKQCTCHNKVQDDMYGINMRVFNPYKNKSGALAFRCTVCKKEK